MTRTEIVGPGKKAGLRFDEHWKSEKVQAGPLPALFLRESALELEKSRVRVGLFLGSDCPLNPANAFKGEQQTRFSKLKLDGEPRFFHDAGTARETAVFADRAVGAPCVDCHDGHAGAPKTDFRVGDIMGATTWTYPKKELTLKEFVRIVDALRKAYRTTYEHYLAKAGTFDDAPIISTRWPRDGKYLPDADFRDAPVAKRERSVGRGAYRAWLVAHVAMSAALAPLVLFHAFVALYYW